MNSRAGSDGIARGSRPAVAFVGLTKRYNDVVALDDVGLEIDEGEFVTILGPSGCGKSTLLRVVSGFQEPTSGDVLLHGQSVVGVPPYRRNTSMVFQDYALFPHRTVAQNIGFGLRMRRLEAATIERRVGDMLDLLGLAGMGDRRIGQISGGQAQRVALGRSLIVEPAVLLLDEPLGALDLKLRKQMQVELKRIQRQVGITFLYVTHDQEEALTMSDRVAVLNRGRLMQYASPLEVYRHPANRFVADFIGETNLIPCRVTGRAGEHVSVVGEGSGERFVAPSAAAMVESAQVTLVVRPEAIRLASTDNATVNVVQAIVGEATFAGPFVRVRVTTAAGVDLIAALRPGDRIPVQGEKVALSWAPDDAILVAID